MALSPGSTDRQRIPSSRDRVPTESQQSPDSPTVVNRQSPTEVRQCLTEAGPAPCLSHVRLCQSVNRQTDTDRQTDRPTYRQTDSYRVQSDSPTYKTTYVQI